VSVPVEVAFTQKPSSDMSQPFTIRSARSSVAAPDIIRWKLNGETRVEKLPLSRSRLQYMPCSSFQRYLLAAALMLAWRLVSSTAVAFLQR
jgi:hypothetical protein